MPGMNQAGARIAKTPDDAKMGAKLKNVKAAEAAFQKLLNSGKVKDIQKARQQIYNKFGVWPNGMTN